MGTKMSGDRRLQLLCPHHREAGCENVHSSVLTPHQESFILLSDKYQFHGVLHLSPE